MAKTEKDTTPITPEVATDKLHAFNRVVAALEPLSKADRLDVLNAAAKFHGHTIKLDV